MKILKLLNQRMKYKSNKIIDFAFFDIKLHISINFAYLLIYNNKG